jgi:CSLREA domain-containing protein
MRATRLAAVTVGLIGSLVLAASASADTVQVTTTDDPAGASSDCSLRNALLSLQLDSGENGCDLVTTSGTDTITFASAIDAIDLTEGELDIDNTAPLKIVGPGMDRLTITAAPDSRVFLLENTGNEVDISGLTVTGGEPTALAGDAEGGGILNQGDLELDGVRVTGNQVDATNDSGSAQALGGGISNQGQLQLLSSIVTGNDADATNDSGDESTAVAAAGIANLGGMFILDSTISQNGTATATDDDAGGSGAAGGLLSGGPLVGTSLTVVSSTFGHNSASATAEAGQAIGVGGISETFGAELELSTVAENIGDASAGPGVPLPAGGVTASSGTLQIESSTIALNGPTDPVGAPPGANLIVAQGLNETSVELSNTLISDPRGGQSNCLVLGTDSSITSDGFNDDFSPTGASCIDSPESTDLDANPLLAAAGLADNGGATETVALQAASPAIDAGSNHSVTDTDPDVDQRGMTRPVDFSGLADAEDGTDIGAFEVQRECAGQATPTASCAGPAPPPANPTNPTGLRAKAMKKCRKIRARKGITGKQRKNKAQKRKKCVKRAKKLPV